MRQLPENVIAYKTLGPFFGKKIPSPIFSRHNTMKGVWGTLEILSGRVNYTLYDTGEVFELSAGDTHIILPQEPHFLVLPEGAKRKDLEILITFHKVPENGQK